MMKQKNVFSLFLSMALVLSLLAGCTNQAASSAQTAVSAASSESASIVDENEAAAQQLLVDLTGSYQEL